MKGFMSRRYPAFYYRDFRLLWAGQFVSNIGSQMQMVALNWQMYILTHSAVALGLIGLVRVVPIIIFSLIGGSVADSYNRRKILLIAQVTMAIFSSCLAIATLTNHVSAPLLYLLTGLSAIAISFNTPARQAFIPSLVKEKDLANAMSLNSIMFQTATIVGPSLAGLVIARFSVGMAYSADAISFVAVILAILAMNASGEIQGEKATVSLAGIKEGIAFVRSQTIVWSTMLLDFFSTFFASATALLPIFAKDILQVGPQGLGLLYAGPSVGAVIAGLVLANSGVLRKEGTVLLTAVACYALGTIVFGISHIFLFSFLALVIVGMGDSVSTIIRNTIRQLVTPDAVRGRMTAINMIFFMGGPQLGEFEAGLLAAAIGAPFSVVVGGVGTLVVVSLMAIFLPTLRRFDQRAQNPL
jgi:MFS family permease